MVNIYTHPSITSFYDEAKEIIWTECKGIFLPEIIIENLKAVMEYTSTHPTIAVFHDLSEAKGTFTKLNSYAKDYYEPLMFKNGVRYFCVVFNEGDIFTKFAINSVLLLIGSKIETKTFTKKESGLKWLNEKTAASVRLP